MNKTKVRTETITITRVIKEESITNEALLDNQTEKKKLIQTIWTLVKKYLFPYFRIKEGSDG